MITSISIILIISFKNFIVHMSLINFMVTLKQNI